MKKISLLVGGIILTTTTVSAYVDMDDRLDALETQMKEISTRNPAETLGANFVGARPETEGTNFYGTFDITYWHTKIGGTEFGVSNNGIESGGPVGQLISLHPGGDLKENDFGWDIGLKAGLGYKTPHDKWDVYLRYTWFRANDSRSVQKNPPGVIIGIRSLLPVLAKRAKSHVDTDYNNLDLELARSYFMSKHYSIRPHFDLKATWLNIKQNIFYTFSEAFLTSLLEDREEKIYSSSKFWGLGPRAGIDGKLFIGDGFNLFGELAGSILYGHFKERLKEKFPVGISDEIGGTLFTARDHYHRFIPFVQMQMGLEWSTYLNDKRQHLGFKIGYEIQYYWRMNQLMQTEEFDTLAVIPPDQNTVIAGARHLLDKISEDVMFYGITGEVRLDF